MSTHGTLKTAAQLDDALRLLDHELSGLQLNTPLRVRAIGGYALLKHGVRSGERAYTMDIDTVTKDYDAAVKHAIEVVAEKAGLEPDWLNNNTVFDNDPEQIERMHSAEWEPQAMDLRNMAVEIATVETLTRAKISSTDEAVFNGRANDAPDLIDLIRHQGIASEADFRAKYPSAYSGMFPVTEKILGQHFAGQLPDMTKRTPADLFPELGSLEDEDLLAGIDDYDYGR